MMPPFKIGSARAGGEFSLLVEHIRTIDCDARTVALAVRDCRLDKNFSKRRTKVRLEFYPGDELTEISRKI